MQWKNKKIRSGDKVAIIAGDAKGSVGRVIRVDREKFRVFVEGANLCTKHVKPSAKDPEGGVRRKESGVHISNVMLVDPTFSSADVDGSRKYLSRLGMRSGEDRKKIRYSKRSGAVIEEKKNAVI